MKKPHIQIVETKSGKLKSRAFRVEITKGQEVIYGINVSADEASRLIDEHELICARGWSPEYDEKGNETPYRIWAEPVTA